MYWNEIEFYVIAILLSPQAVRGVWNSSDEGICTLCVNNVIHVSCVICLRSSVIQEYVYICCTNLFHSKSYI